MDSVGQPIVQAKPLSHVDILVGVCLRITLELRVAQGHVKLLSANFVVARKLLHDVVASNYGWRFFVNLVALLFQIDAYGLRALRRRFLE